MPLEFLVWNSPLLDSSRTPIAVILINIKEKKREKERKKITTTTTTTTTTKMCSPGEWCFASVM